MAGTGGLIPLHGHENKEVLDELSGKDGILYYKGERICDDFSSRSVKIMIDDVWDAMAELEEATGGESDDIEQSEGSTDTE